MQIKFFSVGDIRPLQHFIADNSIRVKEMHAIQPPSLPKDFELCLIFDIDKEKTLTNNFRCFDSSRTIREAKINKILARTTVGKFLISPYTTQKSYKYAFFWEEDIPSIDGKK